LTMEIEDMDKDVFEASELRKKEYSEFATSYASMDAAKGLVGKAAKRLQKFYSPNAPASAAFLSTHHTQPKPLFKGPAPPVLRRLMKDADFDSFLQKASNKFSDTFRKAVKVDPIVLPDTPVKYKKSESGGVMGLMNEMISDLETDMTEGAAEEKHAAKDYVKMMKESKDMRSGLVKTLTNKKVVIAETEERMQQTKQQDDLTVSEIKHLQLYLAQVHTECDFLIRNFENRHESRVDEEHGLASAESIVTHEKVPGHGDMEEVYEKEHSKPQVDAHFPDGPMPVF